MEDKLLTISTTKGIKKIPYRKIIRVMADGAYSYIITVNAIHHCCVHLKIIKKELQSSHYLYPVHRSHIVNAYKIKDHVKKGKKCLLIMSDDMEVPVSKREKPEFMKYYKKIKRIYFESKKDLENKLHAVIAKEAGAIAKTLSTSL